MLTEKSAVNSADESSCCSVCNCLGYCARQNKQDNARPNLRIICPRTFRDFEKSANSGCRYCDYTLQSFQLLGSDSENPEVELLCYGNSPTELHSTTNEDVCDVVEIYPCTYSESLFPKVANDVPRENVPEIALQFIKGIYTCCFDSHSKCSVLVSKLPKRVLDISTDQYRLAEPDEGEKALYATLSYSWGRKNFPVTTRESYGTLKRGFKKEHLPIAFREAALIARSLCIHYIWIDSLCIIQDDDKDWEEQAAQMGQIYESATITIAASSSGNPHESLFASRNAKYEEFDLYDDLGGISENVVFKARRKIVLGMHAKTGRSRDIDPLDTRAWGLQEKLLSHRLISFTSGEIQWTCQTSKACECRTKSYTPQPQFSLPVEEMETKDGHGYAKLWSNFVEPYAVRNLTFETDRLPALSGLAKRFHKITNFTYVAGLWEETIWYDLMWQCDTVRSSTHITEASAPPAYIGPSFSWVSVPSTVNYRLARHTYPGTRIHHMEMVRCDYNTRGRDVFGKAMEARMCIRGTIVEACLRHNTTSSDEYELLIMNKVYQPNADQRKTCEFSIDVHHRRGTKFKTVEPSLHILAGPNGRVGIGDGDMSVVLIGIYSIHHRNHLYQNFLILKPLLCGGNTYERVGIGSGKIYNKNDIPVLPRIVQPFDWLSMDFGSKCGSINTVADQTICLL